MKGRTTFIAWILVVGVFGGCGEDPLQFTTQSYESHTNYDLNAVQFIGPDTGYAVGGKRYDYGVFVKTTNGGQTWQADSLLNKKLYDVHFFHSGQGRICALDGKILRKFGPDQPWRIYQDPAWNPHLGMQFIDRQHGYIVGGESYGNGTFLKTENGGRTWNHQFLGNEFRDVYFLTPREGVLVGYGIILQTSDGGESWDTTNAQGDFFMDVDFPTSQTGYTVGFNGKIMKTTNGGKQWEKIENQFDLIPPRTHFYTLEFWNNSTGYIAGTDGIMMTTQDGGQSWQSLQSFTSHTIYDIWLEGEEKGWIVGEKGTIYQFRN